MNQTLAEIKALAIRQELADVRVQFSDEKMNTLRTKFSTNEIKLDDVQETHKDEREAMAEMEADIKAESKELRRQIRNRFEDTRVNCYVVQNFDTKQVEFYNEDAELVYSRRMNPEEKQLRMAVNS